MRLDLLETLGSLPRHPRQPRAAILEFQARRLRSVVAHAYERVPYYRRLFDAHGVRTAAVRLPADLSALPVTTKADLRAQPLGDIIARGVDPGRLIAHTTSGSSGEPFTIRRTWLEERALGAFRLRAFHGFGMRATDRLGLVGLAHQPHPRDRQLPQRLAYAMGLYRRHLISCLRPPADVLQAVRDARPDIVSAYPGVLSRLADALEDDGRPAPPLRFIVSAGEVLDPDTRRRVSERFGAPVFELYASFEFALIASQCRETGLLHVCDDNVVVEIVRDGQPARPGERGEIVLTSLHARAMPFVRYRLGDLVTRGPDPCPCGAPFSTIASVQGRVLDYLSLPDGRLLHPYEIVTRLPRKPDTWIRRYCIVQDRIDRIVLQIVPTRPPEADELVDVRKTLIPVFGQGVELTLELVADIEPDPSGKHRVSRSRVTTARDRADRHE